MAFRQEPTLRRLADRLETVYRRLMRGSKSTDQALPALVPILLQRRTAMATKIPDALVDE